MIPIVFLILMSFCWGLGGEPWFGKWKRGALLIAPMTLIGLGTLSWIQLILQAALLPLLYQITMPSKLAQGNIWGDKPNKNPVLGWTLIALNGAIFGLTSLFLIKNALDILWITLPAVLAWCGIMYGSNSPKFAATRDKIVNAMPDWYLYKIKDENGNIVKCCQLKDFWFLCECTMGLVLAIIALFVKK